MSYIYKVEYITSNVIKDIKSEYVSVHTESYRMVEEKFNKWINSEYKNVLPSAFKIIRISYHATVIDD